MDHLPEISGSGFHGTLGYDEGPLLLVALYSVCVGVRLVLIQEEESSSHHLQQSPLLLYCTHMYISSIDVIWTLSFQHHPPPVHCMDHSINTVW